MTLFRPMRSRKGLLSLAVISWMLIPLASPPAEAFTSCPCNFTSTLLYSKQTAHTFDAQFDLCSIRTDDGVLLGGEARSETGELPICQLTFEVGERLAVARDTEDTGVCSAQLECGDAPRLTSTDESLMAGPPGFSTLRTNWGLDERSLRACERELTWLIRLARASQCELDLE